MDTSGTKDDAKFYIEYCLKYMALGKNALALYCREKNDDIALFNLVGQIRFLKSKIATQYMVENPNDDLNKACIRCAIERLNHGKSALEAAVKLDASLQTMFEEYKLILLALVNYVIANKDKLKNHD